MIEYEIEVPEGLEQLAEQELIQQLESVHIVARHTGALRIDYRGKPKALWRLRRCLAVYSVERFAVPRPKALLGHEHLSRLKRQIQAVLNLSPTERWQTLHLSAAGAESSVLQRLRQELSQFSGLRDDASSGDLWIRLIRAEEAWQTLVRITPRPLVTRDWRRVNYEGALNAAVASAMIGLAQPQAHENLLNIACGSASLLIESCFSYSAQRRLGIDYAPHALSAATTNIQAAQRPQMIDLLQADATHLPFAPASFEVLVADLPFGQRIGSTAENVQLYPAVLREAARVAKASARFVLITHAIQLMSKLLSETSDWQCISETKVTLRGLHPRIYLLRRHP